MFKKVKIIYSMINVKFQAEIYKIEDVT